MPLRVKQDFNVGDSCKWVCAPELGIGLEKKTQGLGMRQQFIAEIYSSVHLSQVRIVKNKTRIDSKILSRVQRDNSVVKSVCCSWNRVESSKCLLPQIQVVWKLPWATTGTKTVMGTYRRQLKMRYIHKRKCLHEYLRELGSMSERKRKKISLKMTRRQGVIKL